MASVSGMMGEQLNTVQKSKGARQALRKVWECEKNLMTHDTYNVPPHDNYHDFV